MIIVHTPSDGGEVEQFDFKTVRTAEASRITTLLTDKASWPEVKQRLTDDDPDVMRVVGFVLKCRAQPELRLADFDPMVADLAVRFDHREVDEWAEGAASLVAVYEGTATQLEAELSVILDLAADQDYARTVIERVIAGKFPPAPTAR
ncbi:hypothetical protein [Streptomyces filamentosus]|uniref:hypothetical protein n=1 Tax=Streptomyces filamentosus TaxID=67294 RepID=UPI00123A1728|nr:hypothetical protein [Streptomyces filamentosus]KAA6220007.1 hypothetical protein CP979_26250 [Streptomyces filamentosus]KAA6220058.1 hypothetical protein CP979_26540 [Streptomyces filamentosus]